MKNPTSIVDLTMTTNNHDSIDYFTIDCHLQNYTVPFAQQTHRKNIIFEYMGVTLNKNFITTFHKRGRQTVTGIFHYQQLVKTV